jgi:hypothetical protein
MLKLAVAFSPKRVFGRLPITVFAAAVLLFAVGWIQFGEVQPTRALHGKSLAPLFPVGKRPGGWIGRHLPVAETAELADSTWQVLRYDDVINASYTRGAEQIEVFCAYWKPGSMSYRMVAGHNPEVCWPGQGWQCRSKELATLTTQKGAVFPKTRRQSYALHGVETSVLFWHVVDGKIYLPGPSSDIPGKTYLPDLLRMGLRQRGEQYFIRISSGIPLDRLGREQLVGLLLENLALRGILGLPPI